MGMRRLNGRRGLLFRKRCRGRAGGHDGRYGAVSYLPALRVGFVQSDVMPATSD